MPYMRTPHMTARQGLYTFRMAVPKDIRGRIGKREIKVSLRTRDPLHARESCRKLSTYYEQVMRTVAKNPFDLCRAPCLAPSRGDAACVEGAGNTTQ